MALSKIYLIVPVFPMLVSTAIADGLPRYRIVVIDSTTAGLPMSNVRPYDINNRGVVVGAADFPRNGQGFVWSEKEGARATVLKQGGEKSFVGVRAINDDGDFAGSLVPEGGDFEPVVVKRKKNKTEVIPYLVGTWAEYLPSPIKMTNTGKVLGLSDNTKYWVWAENTGLSALEMAELGQARDMNDKNQVVGSNIHDQAFIYDIQGKKTTRFPGRAYSSRAMAINNVGQAVGFYQLGQYSKRLPFIWSEEGGFKTLPGVGYNQEEFGPTDINEHAQVVGYFNHSWQGSIYERSIFYWDPDTAQVVDLQRLIDPADPLAGDVELRPYDLADETQRHIPRINDRGEILVPEFLRSDGRDEPDHTFVLVPVVE